MSFMNKIIASASLLMTLGATAPAVMADTITVPGDFPTIGLALTAATPGDTIIVSKRSVADGGAYIFPVIIAKNDITFTTTDAELDPQGAGTALTISGDRVTISGFTIRNASFFGIAVIGDKVTIQNCTIIACFGTGISILADGATVTGSTIRHCTGAGIEYGQTGLLGVGMFTRNIVELNTGSGMLLSGDRLTVFGNISANNGGDGILIINGGFTSTDPSMISANAIASNNGNGILVSDPGAGPMTIIGNQIHQNGKNGVDLSLGTGATIQRNFLSNNSLSGIMLTSTSAASLIGNNVRSNGRHGIEVSNSGVGAHLVARNYCFFNGRDGLNLLGSNNVMLENFSFDNLGDGIDVVGDGPTLLNVVSANFIFRNAHEGIDNSGITTEMVLNHVLINGNGGIGPDIAGAGNGGIGTLGLFLNNVTTDGTSDPVVAAATSQVVDID
jgi:parallel beta-helix repeat protein